MSDRWMAPAQTLGAIMRRLQRALAPPAQEYVPLRVCGMTVGWVTPERARRLASWRDYFSVATTGVDCAPSLASPTELTAAFAEVAGALAAEGALTTWRDERYAVAARRDDAPLFEIERAAARYFGVQTSAAHANGLVGSDLDWRMWLARRSPTKPIDPGLLDNLVGGGIRAGAGIGDTLVREAWEEAGVESHVAQRAIQHGVVDICRDQPDGLQRETIHVHDLWLPAGFLPRNQDGEAVEHRLCPPADVLALIATDEVTADASLVIVDFLLRHGHVPRDDPRFDALDALRRPDVALALR